MRSRRPRGVDLDLHCERPVDAMCVCLCVTIQKKHMGQREIRRNKGLI